MEFLEKSKEFYRAYLQSRYGSPRGATISEIDALEKNVGSKLPGAYREFLLWMGNDVEGAFRGSDWFLKDVMENTSYLPELLEENGLNVELPKAFLSFFCHQGYMAGWFELSESSDDPECYFYTESSPASIERGSSFSEFLLKELRAIA